MLVWVCEWSSQSTSYPLLSPTPPVVLEYQCCLTCFEKPCVMKKYVDIRFWVKSRTCFDNQWREQQTHKTVMIAYLFTFQFNNITFETSFGAPKIWSSLNYDFLKRILLFSTFQLLTYFRLMIHMLHVSRTWAWIVHKPLAGPLCQPYVYLNVIETRQKRMRFHSNQTSWILSHAALDILGSSYHSALSTI